MADIKVRTPYTSAARLAVKVPNWLNEYDAQRHAAYDTYDSIYSMEPGIFKIIQRGSEENPLYLPTGRTIINTLNRYIARGWNVTMRSDVGTPEQRLLAQTFIDDLMARERLRSTFRRAKKWGLIRGDWGFYITGDPDKPEGRRLTIRSIDPRMVFPVYEEGDADNVLGVDIIEQVTEGDSIYIKKQRYLKSSHPENGGVPGGPITYEKTILELENWETEPKTVRTDFPKTILSDKITNLPVYMIPNGDPEPGNPWGVSDFSGLERLFGAINQSASDEELALALEGLGMYKSGKGQPRDSAGNPTSWVFGPGRVVHDETFQRVNGVNTIGPFKEHIEKIQKDTYETTGANEVARGVVDVTVAESGIALKLRMGPILDEAAERNLVIEEVMNQFLFDLVGWVQAYEGSSVLDNVKMVSTFESALPEDDAQFLEDVMNMASGELPIISTVTARDMLRKRGWDIPENEGETVLNQLQAVAEAADPVGARLAAEGNAPDPDEEGDETAEE